MNKKTLVFLSSLLGLVFLIITFVYATHSAGMLPHFFPGFEAGVATKHVKHAIASFVVAAACFIFAWFQSGPKQV